MAELPGTQPAPNGRDGPQRRDELAGRHILLAEDSPDQQRLFAALLQHAGASVTLECNGEAAVETVATSEGKFDAIIMDFEMPVMDGVEATTQIRLNGYEGPIIAITAFGCEVKAEEWLWAGADVFLPKTAGFVNLVSTLQRLTQPIPSSQDMTL